MRVRFWFRILVKARLRVQDKCRFKIRIRISFASGLDWELV